MGERYSQNDEQDFVLEAFGDTVGRFLDIGAGNGKLNSNTLALVERGWSGVLVEPSPLAFLELQERHGKNLRLTLIHAAVGLDYDLTPFWDTAVALGFSTTEQGNRDKWEPLAHFQEAFYVPTVPMISILQGFPGPVDFLDIDTEGTSVDLFLEFPFARPNLYPKVICLEHDGRIKECEAIIRWFHYREVSRNAENSILVRVDH